MSQLITGGKLILASGSPRRKELLKKMGLQFEVRPPSVDESQIPADHPRTYALRCAYAKAMDVANAAEPGDIVLAADTIVTKEMVIYGKPKDADEARSILRQLSFRTHQVITGVAVAQAGKPNVQLNAAETSVTFHNFTDQMIEAYVQTGSPLDKAGAYGIQDLGPDYLNYYEGEYSNVVGLPCSLIAEMLEQYLPAGFNFEIPRN
ncbi:MAG: Maf family protein [Sumerlaeia bacterium]